MTTTKQAPSVKSMCATCNVFSRLVSIPGSLEKEVCYECFQVHELCDSCSEVTHEEDLLTLDDGDSFCPACVQHLCTPCSICEGIYPREALLYIGRDSLYYCEYCSNEHSIVDPDSVGSLHYV